MKFDPEKIGGLIRALLAQAGIHPPIWLTQITAWLALIALALCALWGVLFVLAQIKELVSGFMPYRLSQEVRRKLSRRRRFIEHIENEIRRLNIEQSWSDYRFAELEAEVEAEGRHGALPFLPLLIPRTTSGLRRERSLTKALDKSRERLILVEGDPGSGKSVALKHVASQLALRARSGGPDSLIPLYVNLKEIERPPGRSIDRNLIEDFVLHSLNRANDRDVEEFLEQEFRLGLNQGTWLFLFDSFDEISEILGSTEPDAVIREYTRAIDDFLHGMNRCRGVVASRYFRGPGQVPWPRFRILPLSLSRREELVEKADLPVAIEREVLGFLPWAAERLGDQAQNPLFLSLICEHMKNYKPFPESGHALFESYISQRLLRDEGRIRRRFYLEPTTVRTIAEQVAFCMAADAGLGLSPSRNRIAESLARLGLEPSADLAAGLDTLEFIKLARAEGGSGGSEKLFTFAHRRFQEYFATCLVQASIGLVEPQSLLFDGRWRETAIVICQTAPAETLEPLLVEARRFLCSITAAPIIKEPATPQLGGFRDFPWSPGTLHLAGLLQDGFSGRSESLPEDLRLQIGEILAAAFDRGTLADRKWSLEVGGASDDPTLISLLKEAFLSPSRWLAEVGYRQAGKLRRIPDEIAFGIHSALLLLFLRGELRRERHATFAHLSRLEGNESFLSSLQALLALPLIELAFQAFALLAFLALIAGIPRWPPLFAALAGLTLLSWIGLNIAIPALARFELFIPNLGYIFLFRLLLALLALLVLSAIEKDHIGFARWPFYIFVGTIGWGFSVLVACEGGLIRRLAVLPLAPLIVIGQLLRSLNRLTFNWRLLLRGFLITFVVPLLIAAVIVKGFLPSQVVRLMGLIISAIMGVALSVGICELVFRWFKDRRLFRNSLASTSIDLTAEQFIATVTAIRFNRFRIQYIRSIRQKSMLSVNTETELLVVNLAIKVEVEFRRLRGRGLGVSVAIGRRWSSDALDELYRLREAIRVVPIAAALSTGTRAAGALA